MSEPNVLKETTSWGSLDKDGIIVRDGPKVIARVRGETGARDKPGVTCENPDDPFTEQVFRKEFPQKPIFMPDQYQDAMAKYIDHPGNFVISMNGYSCITDDQCRRYGVQKGAFEESCKAILRNTLLDLRGYFSVSLRLIHGASVYEGIDRAIQEVADELNIVPLGFSCPRYMLYVPDDHVPVFVAQDRAEYADYYIMSLHLLITTGGRAQTLQHDVLCACMYQKRIHFVDVLNNLSSKRGCSRNDYSA